MDIKPFLLCVICAMYSCLGTEPQCAITGEVVNVSVGRKIIYGHIGARQRPELNGTGNPLQINSDFAKWFDFSMDTSAVTCNGELSERCIAISILNNTTNAFAIHRADSGFRYAIKYRNARNESCFFTNEFSEVQSIGCIEVLAEKSVDDNVTHKCKFIIYPDVVLPTEYVSIEKVAIELELVPLVDIGRCHTTDDLRKLFKTNVFRKVIMAREHLSREHLDMP